MEDEGKKEKSTPLKLNLRCRRAALLKGNIYIYIYSIFFFCDREEELDCFEEEVDSKMEGGESFD